MRKTGVDRPVLRNAHAFITAYRSFQVDQIPNASVAVRDLADRAVCQAHAVLLLPDGTQIDLDPGTKIGFANPHQIAHAAKLQELVALCIRRDNDFAAPAYQFVDTQIFKVPPIRYIDEEIVFIG